jgi:hypothetical protein
MDKRKPWEKQPDQQGFGLIFVRYGNVKIE